MVKLTFDPTVTVPLLAILVTAISALETTLVRSVAVSFAVLTSPPPETVAVFVTGVTADWATLTVIEMDGNDALLATTAVLVQVTVWQTLPQVQPAPEAAVGVSPAGGVSGAGLVPLGAGPPS